MDPASFLQGRTRETKIRRDARGHWYNEDTLIEHPNLVRSFDSWVDRAEDGRFCLSNAINWAYVAIEGPPYFVKDAAPSGEGLRLRLSGEREETVGLDDLFQDVEGALWCAVREGRCPARFENHALGKIAGLVGQDDQGVSVEVGAKRVRPPVVEDPLSLGLQKR
jgi:uncharacterized protein